MNKVIPIDPVEFSPQQYTEGDIQTIPSFTVNSTFSSVGGKVESIIFDTQNNFIAYNPNNKFSSTQTGAGGNVDYTDNIVLDPEADLASVGLTKGSYNILYNFINNELKSSFNKKFRIKEISANRKEVRLTTGFLDESELEQEVNNFYPSSNSPSSYPDFYLNFGEGSLFIANNILFDGTGDQYSILVKLYKSLPSFIEVDSDTNPWICTLQRKSIAYNVTFENKVFPIKTTIDLKGPNFSLDLNNQTHTPTKPTSYADLNYPSGIDSSSHSSSYYQIQNILENKGVEVNIDYTDMSNFIHFSSAEERVKNFYYKVGLLEEMERDLPTAGDARPSIEKKIESIIKNFDGFENWMYYSSASNQDTSVNFFPSPYPKKSFNGLPPYKFYLTGSTTATEWYEEAIQSASIYDANNQDALLNTIPQYIIEDPDSENYLTFVKMMGHHFDTLFTYIQDITNRYNGDNRLDFGISKDLVGEAIKSMGINLYTGNFTGTDILNSLIGVNVEGGNVNFLPTLEDGSSGYVENYITASNYPTPIEDVNKEIYKRIYHNLPLLLRQKGSIAGVRTLINCFGIPKEILDVKEFNIQYQSTTPDFPAIETSESIQFKYQDVILPFTISNDIPDTLLSPAIRVQQHPAALDDYSRDLHYTEIGYSPQGYIDETSYASFDPIANDFPNFNDFYQGDPDYYNSKFKTQGNATSTGGSELDWTLSAYIRYIKFFDTSLFQMLKDFVPVRNSTATGVIIKPTIKERQRYRPAQIQGSKETYEAVVDSEYYKWAGSGGEFVTRAIGDLTAKSSSIKIGGTGGAFEAFNRQTFGIDNDDFKNEDKNSALGVILQYQSESIYVTRGYSPVGWPSGSSVDRSYNWGDGSTPLYKYYDRHEEFYNGEFPQLGQRKTNYLSREYRGEGTDTGLFTYDNNPQNPYKKPFDALIGGLSLGVASTNYEILVDPGHTDKDIIFRKLFNNVGVFFIAIGGVDGTNDELSLESLQQNIAGFIYLTGSENYNFAVSNTPSISNIYGAPRYAFQSAITPNSNYSSFANETEVALVLTISGSGNESDGPWAYSDYNPLVNNSFDPQAGFVNYNGIRKSTEYMDADYSPSAPTSINPINVKLLASGSASKAAVQDSYYSSQWWNNSRYLGVRRSSLGFNISIEKGANLEGIFSTSSLGLDVAQSSSTSTGATGAGFIADGFVPVGGGDK